MTGGLGNDTILVADTDGTDTITGGEDPDGLDVDLLDLNEAGSGQGVTVTMTGDEEGGYDFDGTDAEGTFAQIETLDLTDEADTFDGTLATGGSTVDGGAGDDSLLGSTGNDSFTGGAGDDTIAGEEGDDTINAGDGDDVIVINDSFGNDTITGGEGDETSGDVLDASGATDDLTLDLSAVSSTDPESGTLSDGTSTATFEEIETVILGSGDDSVTGSAGDDSVSAGAGADTLDLGAGDDTIDLGGGAGGDDAADVIVLQDGSGSDVITSFDAPTSNGDGTFTGTDTFDVTALNGADGIPVNTNDVTVTDDGSGNAVLTFPNGESVTLDGISPADADDPFYLNAIGIPLPDGTVSGTAGNDIIDSGYVDLTDGDTIDAGDAILTGHDPQDDLIEAGAGDDVIDGNAGDDTIFAGTGDDTINVTAGEGTDVITGGEDGAGGDIDTLGFTDTSGTEGVNVTMTDDEEGTYAFPTDGGSGKFVEIEALELTDQDDTFNGSAVTNGSTVDAGAGNDTLVGGLGGDSLSGGAGDDQITFSEGDDIDGGAGDDTIIFEDLGEPTNGVITIDGGAGDETDGDTLQLGTLGVLTQEVVESFVDDGTGSFSGSITLNDGTILNFSEIENIICFTPKTRIATPHGLIAIENLKVGDLVVTRDHGLQPIRWIESRTVPAVDRFAPVRIRKSVLQGQDRDLIVSPQHRVLFQGYRAELLFGESEVLVSAKHLVDGMDVTQDETGMVTYVHMMFDCHEIIFAEGAATESFHPGDIGMDAVSDPAREEMFAIFPELRSDTSQYGNTARRCLKRHEAKLIRS